MAKGSSVELTGPSGSCRTISGDFTKLDRDALSTLNRVLI
jgi:hypothetical protein